MNGYKQCEKRATLHSNVLLFDLIPKALESIFPLAVTDDNNKLSGLILRVHVLSGLVSDEVEESEEYHG